MTMPLLQGDVAIMSLQNDAGFEEGKHPRAENGQFGSGAGNSVAAAKHTAYSAGNASYDADLLDAADYDNYDAEVVHEDPDAGDVKYDVGYSDDHDAGKTHADFGNVHVFDQESDEFVPLADAGMSKVKQYKLKKRIAASLGDELNDRAKGLTEEARVESLTDEEREAEAAAEKAKKNDAEAQTRGRVNSMVDRLVAGGWRPRVNETGGWARPGELREFASPKTQKIVAERLAYHGVSLEPKKTAQDSIALDRASVRRIDQDGHLFVEKTPISKANVCPYAGKEIPDFEKLGLDAEKIYQLYRDPDELAKSAPTFAGKPLLIIHKPVSAGDHPREITVGSIGDDVTFEAPYLMAPLNIWDGEAIQLIQSEEQKELSCGYRYDPDMTPGSAEGERYDGVMRNISGNHLALVEEGRCGPTVVVADGSIFGTQWADIERALLGAFFGSS